MKQDYPFDPAADANRAVFEYIRKFGAHSDLVELLIPALKPLGDIQTFSPGSYGYFAVSTKGIIIAFVIGTDTIAFRLDNRMKERAIATGGNAFPECGDGWVAFEPFRPDWPRVDFEFWARKAYVFVREAIP